MPRIAKRASKLLTRWERLESDLKNQLRTEMLIIHGIDPHGAEYISNDLRKALAEGDFEKWSSAFHSENSKLRFLVEQYYSKWGSEDGQSFRLANDNEHGIVVSVTKKFLRETFRDARFPLPPNPVVSQDIQQMESSLRSAWIAKLVQYPWHPAIASTCTSLLESLVKSGDIDLFTVDVEIKGKGRCGTFLEAALAVQNIDAAKELLRLGSNIEQIPANGFDSIKAGDYRKFLSVFVSPEWMRVVIDDHLRSIAASGMHASIALATPAQQSGTQGGRKSRHGL